MFIDKEELIRMRRQILDMECTLIFLEKKVEAIAEVEGLSLQWNNIANRYFVTRVVE